MGVRYTPNVFLTSTGKSMLFLWAVSCVDETSALIQGSIHEYETSRIKPCKKTFQSINFRLSNYLAVFHRFCVNTSNLTWLLMSSVWGLFVTHYKYSRSHAWIDPVLVSISTSIETSSAQAQPTSFWSKQTRTDENGGRYGQRRTLRPFCRDNATRGRTGSTVFERRVRR